MEPRAACWVNSVQARLAHGPVRHGVAHASADEVTLDLAVLTKFHRPRQRAWRCVHHPAHHSVAQLVVALELINRGLKGVRIGTFHAGIEDTHVSRSDDVE